MIIEPSAPDQIGGADRIMIKILVVTILYSCPSKIQVIQSIIGKRLILLVFFIISPSIGIMSRQVQAQ